MKKFTSTRERTRRPHTTAAEEALNNAEQPSFRRRDGKGGPGSPRSDSKGTGPGEAETNPDAKEGKFP